MISTENRIFLQTPISLQSSCRIVLAGKKSHPGRMGLRALTGWPRAWSLWSSQVSPQAGMWHVAAVSPPKALLPAGHSTVQFKFDTDTLVWPQPHRQRSFGDWEVPFPSPCPAHSHHPLPPTAASPTEAKGSDQSDLVFFPLFLCFICCWLPVCHILILMKILVTSEGFKISKTHFLLHIPAGIAWKIIIWSYIYLYPIILYSKQLPWGRRNHIKMHANWVNKCQPEVPNRKCASQTPG